MKTPTALTLLALSLAVCARALPSQLVLHQQQQQLKADMPAAAESAATLHAEDFDSYVGDVQFTALTELSKDDFDAYMRGAQDHVAEPGSGWVWQSCGLDADVVRVDRVDVVPDPPRSGQNMTVKAAGEVRADVDDGSVVDVVVKLGLIRLLSKRFDLCEIARENDAQLQCPLKPGFYEIEHTVSLPRGIPPTKFNVHLTGLSQTELDLLCLDLSIDFGRH